MVRAVLSSDMATYVAAIPPAPHQVNSHLALACTPDLPCAFLQSERLTCTFSAGRHHPDHSSRSTYSTCMWNLAQVQAERTALPWVSVCTSVMTTASAWADWPLTRVHCITEFYDPSPGVSYLRTGTRVIYASCLLGDVTSE